ncbi:MAG: hypothetical protein WC777_00550 [Candidatus Gracilibacteria bacterium]|jgi:hypothetical protein
MPSDEVRDVLLRKISSGATNRPVTPVDLTGKPGYKDATAPLSHQEAALQRIRERVAQLVTTVYELSWKGPRIPKGVKIGGFTIGFANRGALAEPDGGHFATYERVEENGGAAGDEQKIRVYLTSLPRPSKD